LIAQLSHNLVALATKMPGLRAREFPQIAAEADDAAQELSKTGARECEQEILHPSKQQRSN
jgi:hypothetical protein